MKKYLYSALALPLLFACSSENFDEKVISNDQFAGIEKVDATFSMDGFTRMATDWVTENGDMYGFAWMGDGTKIIPGTDGLAYQNHPLTQTAGIFKPATSIYVGDYYIYRPYDETVVSPAAINFNSLKNQTLKDGKGGQAWRDLAPKAIVIGDKWTNVKVGGTDVDGDGKMWNKAGMANNFKIWASVFSNQTALDLTYTKNNVTFNGTTEISGATDIKFKPAAGTKVGAADIYKVTVALTGAPEYFTYAPKKSPNAGDHSGVWWEKQKNLVADADNGFTFYGDKITLNAPTATGISTDKDTNKGWFWFNSLPVTAGNADHDANVQTFLTTSYGVVEINKSLAECAYAYEDINQLVDKHEISGDNWDPDWIKLADADADKTATEPTKWRPTLHNTFVNQYGNHKGKYAFEVDFSKGVMAGMEIKDDAHLQKALKYYIASGKNETPAPIVLDLLPASATDATFKLSKISIALLQTINKSSNKVRIDPTGLKIIVTQDDQAELNLADKKEVPALNKVFSAATNVYLSKDCDWTWSGGEDGKTALPVDNVTSIINEGTASTKLTVYAENIQLTNAATTLKNEKGATMNITKVTTVKNALTNNGTINVGDNTVEGKKAELRAYQIAITNNATTLTDHGVINNWGVVGVSDTDDPKGSFNNYGLIDMKDGGAITLLTTNQVVSNFDTHFTAGTNMMGTVALPESNPTALVSINNADANGFIEYIWPANETTYATPAGNVKYNTIIVSNDITFAAAAPEVKYIKFNGTRTQVVNPTTADKLANLKGVIVNAGKSIIIEKGNQLVCANDVTGGAFLGANATVYLGGTFTHRASVAGKTASNYFGDWSIDQIVKY